MKNFILAFRLYLIGYLIATIVGFSTYYININVMWVTIFTVMPVVFGYLFYLYLKKTECSLSETFKETNRLVIFWIIISFLLDALVNIIIVPIIYGHKSNWTFFIDQSPWIWLNYVTIIILGHIARLSYHRRLKKLDYLYDKS